MAWGQSIAQGLGRAGSEAGVAVDANLQTALEVIKNKLLNQEVQSRLREQEIRTKQMQQPIPQGVFTTPQGAFGATFDPNTGKYGASQLQGIPPSQAAQRPPALSPESIQEWSKALPESARQSAVKAVEGFTALGDYENALKLMGQTAGKQEAAALRPPSSSGTLMGMIVKAQSGGVGAKEAQEALKTYLAMQNSMASARGQAYGAGRAMYMIQSYIDPDTGQMVPLSNLDAISAIHSGKNFIPSGRLPASTAMSVQQLVSEATPALKEVRSHLGAFDSAADRAIFARVLANNPAAIPGQEQQWLGTVLNQALTGNLSEDGRALVVRLNRLNESVGRLRAVLGLPATERMVAMTLAMVPGPTTPDSRMARDVLDNLDATITNAVQVPMLGGIGNQRGGNTPPPGATVKSYDPATGTVK